ncbi:MAG TPA: DNA polymerase IV [Candidatus Limnocylindrales bacterium]|nr:DNA polymerase IV [Candidatus Limnocylindrales bacterium]
MQRIILHIDFDSFFASAEQQFNPLLRGRPIGVTATNGRTCIIAASREAKALGIKSPTRTFEAQRIYPSIIFVPAHFTKYWEVSKIFVNACKDFSPLVEIFSLDEVFMDVTRTAELFGGTLPLIEKIKSRLQVEIGEYITASFGISHNKLLAKLASGLEKPNGVVMIKPEDVQSIYQTTKLTDICGIGYRIEARLNQMGIYKLTQLSAAPLQALIAEFGNVEGIFLHQVGQGLDTREVIPHTQDPGVKSVGRNYCLPANEYSKRKVLQNVFELCEEVGIKLRRLNKKARNVGIFLRGDENVYGRKTYSYFMDSGKDLFDACHSLLTVFPDYTRQIGIWASYLEDSDKIPSSLFDTEKKRKLRTTIDQINERFGDHTIRNGFLLDSPKLTTVPNGFMADRFEREKFAKEQKIIESLA